MIHHHRQIDQSWELDNYAVEEERIYPLVDVIVERVGMLDSHLMKMAQAGRAAVFHIDSVERCHSLGAASVDTSVSWGPSWRYSGATSGSRG